MVLESKMCSQIPINSAARNVQSCLHLNFHQVILIEDKCKYKEIKCAIIVFVALGQRNELNLQQ